MPARQTLILGTTNPGKLRELEELLAPYGIPCRSLAGLPQAVAVDETGTTFAENAALKAGLQAQALEAWVLAEDSGLVVDALDGAPGIFSARFSGAEASDAANNRLLLERLAAHPHAPRSAHYACHAALADPAGRIMAVSSGTCAGSAWLSRTRIRIERIASRRVRSSWAAGLSWGPSRRPYAPIAMRFMLSWAVAEWGKARSPAASSTKLAPTR